MNIIMQRELARKPVRPSVRSLCPCPTQTGYTAACSRCGHCGCPGDTCPHCGPFYPLKSRPELIWWQEQQGMGGAVMEAAFTARIIKRLDGTAVKENAI